MEFSTLDIEITYNLDRLIFKESGEILGIVNHPRLLWECSCQPTTGGRSPQKGPCVLHSLNHSSRISELFGLSTRIWYRNTSMVWNGSGWPPSLDSFFLLKTILDVNWPNKSSGTLWDMGAGTGFLGLHVANSNQSIKKIIAVEVDPLSAKICKINLEQLNLSRAVESVVVVSSVMNLNFDDFQPEDSIISNPPYLPLPMLGKENINLDTDVALGTAMLTKLIELASRCKITVAMCYSSLAEIEVQQALSKFGNQIEYHLLAERNTPLRLDLPDWYIDWLINQRGLRQFADDVFCYWHTVKVAIFSNINKE